MRSASTRLSDFYAEQVAKGRSSVVFYESLPARDCCQVRVVVRLQAPINGVKVIFTDCCWVPDTLTVDDRRETELALLGTLAIAADQQLRRATKGRHTT